MFFSLLIILTIHDSLAHVMLFPKSCTVRVSCNPRSIAFRLAVCVAINNIFAHADLINWLTFSASSAGNSRAGGKKMNPSQTKEPMTDAER